MGEPTMTTKRNSFNEFICKNFTYDERDEEEIRSQIYQHKATNDIANIITILKNKNFYSRCRIGLGMEESTIVINITICFTEDISEEVMNNLIKTLHENIQYENIRFYYLRETEDHFNWPRYRSNVHGLSNCFLKPYSMRA